MMNKYLYEWQLQREGVEKKEVYRTENNKKQVAVPVDSLNRELK